MCTHMYTHPHLPHSCSCPEPSVNTGHPPAGLPTTLPLVLTRALSRVPDFVACLKDSHCCPGSGLCHQAPRHPSKSHPHSRAAAGGRDPAHGPPTPQGASPTFMQVAHTNPSRGCAHPTQLTQGPVTSGGCRETPSVTSSCTHLCHCPAAWGPGPSLLPRGSRPGEAWVLGRRPAAERLLSPRAVVGKSRTTGPITSPVRVLPLPKTEGGGRRWRTRSLGRPRPAPRRRPHG